MDYDNKDLTRNARHYSPIKTSHITNPYDGDLNHNISRNFQELKDLLLSPQRAQNGRETLEKLEEFFQKANTGNNIQNILVYGDESKKGDNRFSNTLSQLDRAVHQHVQKHGKDFPALIEIQSIWNEFKEQIPEKIEHIQTVRQHVRSALKENLKNAANKEDITRELNKLKTANSRFNALLKEEDIEPSALKASWKRAEDPQPLRKKLRQAFGIPSKKDPRHTPATEAHSTYTAQQL